MYKLYSLYVGTLGMLREATKAQSSVIYVADLDSGVYFTKIDRFPKEDILVLALWWSLSMNLSEAQVIL